MNKIKRSTERLLVENAWCQKMYRPQYTYSRSNIQKQQKEKVKNNNNNVNNNNNLISSQDLRNVPLNKTEQLLKSKRLQLKLPEKSNQFYDKQTLKGDDFIIPSQPIFLPESIAPTPFEYQIMNKLKVSDLQYQTLLIKQKEIDLEIFEEQLEHKKLKGHFKMIEGPLHDIRSKIPRLQNEIKKKTEYIKLYYDYLATKLSVDSSSIFTKKIQNENKLEIEYQELENHYIKQSETLNYTLRKMQEQLGQMSREEQKLHDKVEKIHQVKIKHIETKQKFEEELEDKYAEYQKVQEEFDELQKVIDLSKTEETKLNEDIKNLKELLSIEEEHDRACLVIQRAIILRESQKTLEEINKRELSKDFDSKKIPELQQLIRQRKKQNEMILRKIQSKQG